MKKSHLFCKLFGLFNIFKVINCVRIHTHIIVSALIETGFTGWVQGVLSRGISWLLELVQILFNVTLILGCVHGLGHELAHKVRHLAHWHAANLVGAWFARIDNFLCLLLGKGSFFFKYLVLFWFLLSFSIFGLKFAHQLTHQISCTFRRLLNLFLLFVLFVLIVFWLFHFTLFFHFWDWILWRLDWWLYERWCWYLWLRLAVTGWLIIWAWRWLLLRCWIVERWIFVWFQLVIDWWIRWLLCVRRLFYEICRCSLWRFCVFVCDKVINSGLPLTGLRFVCGSKGIILFSMIEFNLSTDQLRY